MTGAWRRHLAALTLVTAGVLTVLTQLPAHADVRTVYVGSFYFSGASGGPDNTAISIENGDQLRFVAQDNGHTVEIPELGISQALSKGQTFTTKALTKAGTFALYCAPHRNKGHQTTLTVRAAAAEPPPSPAPEPTSEPAPPPATQPAPAPSKTKASGGSTSTTTSPASSGSTSGGASTAPGAAASSPTSGSPASSAPVATTSAPQASTSPAAAAAEGAKGAEQSTGLGTAEQDEVAVPAAEGSLEDLIGRPPAADGSWTRSVWMALGLLLPMTALAGVALARRERLPTVPDAD